MFVYVVGVAGAVAAALAVQVRLLPEIIDISSIPTGAGLGSLAATFYGALLRFDADRLGRLALFGTLVGGAATTAVLILALLLDVLS